VLAYDVHDLATQADVVARGTVAKAEARWEGKRIVTDVTLSVAATLKGARAAQLTFVVPGGVADGVGMVVPGAPSFAPGEDVVVFLRRQAGAYAVVGLGQGKYHLARDKDGATIATPALEGLSLVRALPDGSLAPASPPKALKLSDLEAEVARALGR